MAFQAVSDAVKARFATNNLGMPVFGPNELAEAPSDASSFVAYEFPLHVPSEQVTIGSPGTNRVREHGALQVTIAAQRGGGVDAGLAIADQIALLFRNFQSGNMRFFLPSPPIFDDRNQDGNYYRMSLSVPYQNDSDNG